MVLIMVFDGRQLIHIIIHRSHPLRIEQQRIPQVESLCSENPKKRFFLHVLHDDAAIALFFEPASDLVRSNCTTTRPPPAKLYDQHTGVIWIHFCDQVVSEVK